MARPRRKAIAKAPLSQRGAEWCDPKVVRKIGSVIIIERAGVFIVLYKGKEARASTMHRAVRLLKRAFPRPVETVTEIAAYRVFKLRGEYLTPVITGHATTIFEGPVMTADQLPTMNNTSGLHSVIRTNEQLQYLIDTYKADVYATVGLLGTVVIHEIGHRAERQIIRSLTLLVPSSAAFRDFLARKYDCEVSDGWKQELTP